ncbi:MAG: hypothetical protein ABIH42_09725, partial [Planctomycetota bacterium]
MRNLFTKMMVFSVLVSVFAGCASSGMIEPAFDTIDKKIVFVPFRERDIYFFESEDGKEISALLATLVRSKSEELTVLDVAPAIPLIAGKEPEDIDWQKV